MLKTFHNFIQRARVVSLGKPERAKEVLEEHKAILQAIIEGDAQKAEVLTNEHVRKARESLVFNFKK
jgi:DNA-binding GntR family transcriptional regulator